MDFPPSWLYDTTGCPVSGCMFVTIFVITIFFFSPDHKWLLGTVVPFLHIVSLRPKLYKSQEKTDQKTAYQITSHLNE